LKEEDKFTCLLKARVIDTLKKEGASADAIAAATTPEAIMAQTVVEMERMSKIPDVESYKLFQFFYQAGVDAENRCVFNDDADFHK